MLLGVNKHSSMVELRKMDKVQGNKISNRVILEICVH